MKKIVIGRCIRNSKLILLVLLVTFILCGCVVHHQARLYDLQTGDVILVDSRIVGNRATTEAILPTGEHCKGECVSGGDVTIYWGNLYSAYYGSVGYYAAAIPLSQRGVGTLICDRKTVLDCEYVVSSFSVQGHGICRDNRGKIYRLIF